jgi:hypothetical protein
MALFRTLAVAAVVLVAVPALAQGPSAASSLPRVEFGLGAGSGLWLGEAGNVGAIDLRVTGRLTPRFGIEFVTDILANDLSADRAYGVYILQGAYLVGGSGSGGLAVFVTFGGLGGFERYRSRGGSWTAPDGQVYTWPAESRTEIYPATELVGGVAVQKVIARHLAVRGDAQLIICPHGAGVGLRLAGGVSVPLAGYGRPSSARN